MDLRRFVLIIFVFAAVFIAFSYETIFITLTKQIPISISLQYNSLKSQYSCNYCFASIQRCKDANESVIYLVEGGSHQGSGIGVYLDNKDRLICTSKWSFSNCKGGCPLDFFRDCPAIKECKTIIEWEGEKIT